jgi:Na+-transporting NADH:ubiquinone oxidoreductase subunit A
MAIRFKIRKGLDIPVAGKPVPIFDEAREPETVAAVATDVRGMRPSMSVRVGDRVRTGDMLFEDKRNKGVPFAATGCGEVIAINRGAKRSLQSVVIRLDGDEAVEFDAYRSDELPTLGREKVRENLIASGLWTAFRTRPFGRVPPPESAPAAIFVTAIDTYPLAVDPAVIINDDAQAFANGIALMTRLTDGKVYLCTAPDSGIAVPDLDQVHHAEFEGPHPAGLAGTHIHLLEPVSANKTVWHIGYQHILAMGRLFSEGQLSTRRVVAVGGPKALRPRLLRTRMGASVNDILKGEIDEEGPVRVISGSILSGHRASGPLAYLGRYHRQITVLAEGSEREFMHWARPGFGKYSATRAFAGHYSAGHPAELNTSRNGSARALVPTGAFEKVMPLDILATPLLKSIVVQDTDTAQQLGALELDEEDLALCSFVCNGKYDYGPALRETLDEIEVNG